MKGARSREQGAGKMARRPIRLPRLIWIRGLQHEGETKEQMLEREARLREIDAEIDEIERKAEAARARPVWKC